MKKIEEISVFFPAYNEEKNIEKTVTKASNILKNIFDNYEIFVIDDGSKDKTADIVKKLAQKDKRIKIIQHKTNRGYGAALKTGLYSSKYDWIVFLDSDGQFDFSEITKFLSAQKETNADLVIGSYINRKVSFIRKMNSFFWEIAVYLLFGLKAKDIDCGFKLVNREVINNIPQLESERGAFITTEFLVKAKLKNFKIVQIPVHHYPREKGAATGANLNVIIGSFKDLFKLRKKLNKINS